MRKKANVIVLLLLTLARHRIASTVSNIMVIAASEIAKDDVNSPRR
jgi:hypothetical protein